MSKIEEIETSKAKVYRSERGHIVIQVHDKQELDVEDIRQINEAKNKLAKGNRYTVIFKTGKYGSISPAARKLSASKEVYHNAIAKAIVAGTMSERIVGNFFVNINKPPAPTKVVKDDKEAMDWLESHLKNLSDR